MTRVRLAQVSAGSRFWLVPGLSAYERGLAQYDPRSRQDVVLARKLTAAGVPAEDGWPRTLPAEARVWVTEARRA